MGPKDPPWDPMGIPWDPRAFEAPRLHNIENPEEKHGFRGSEFRSLENACLWNGVVPICRNLAAGAWRVSFK